MLGLSCEYRQDRFVVIHPPLESWVRRNCPDKKIRDRLFVYYSIENSTYVVALWEKVGQSFYDVLNMGESLSNFDMPQAEAFQQMFAEPCTGERMEELARAFQSTRIHEAQDREREQAEKLERLINQKVRVSLGG